MGHFSPDCHLYSMANSTCPTEQGHKRNGRPLEAQLVKYADPLVDVHNDFSAVMKPFAYTLENPASGRLVKRKVGGKGEMHSR